ncbi:MAG: DUF2797 domain-containing protein [Myxococcota bacterium]
MGDRALVTGFTWAEGGVRLHLWAGDPPVPDQRAITGAVCFRVLPGRHCTGYHDGEQRRPCPDRAECARGSTCDPCARRDAFRPCMTCDGFRCPRLSSEMLDYCRQTHHLYLACFGDETIKVGTASDGRREQRIVEQGPLAASRIAAAEGPTIKRMEHLLSSAGLSETMRRSRKTALLQGAMSEATARARVRDAASQVRSLLPAEYHPFLHPPVDVPQPELARRTRGLSVNELRLEPDRVVEGTVVGAIGHLVFVEEPDGRFAFDVGELKGRRIEWDPEGPRRKPQVQLGLF